MLDAGFCLFGQPNNRLLIKRRCHDGITGRTGPKRSDRILVSLQPCGNFRRCHIPHHECPTLLGIPKDVLSIAGPANFGIGKGIIGMTIKVAQLFARDGVNDDIARRVGGKCQVFAIGRNCHVHDGKGNVFFETTCCIGRIQIDFRLLKVIRQIKKGQIRCIARITNEVVASSKANGFGCGSSQKQFAEYLDINRVIVVIGRRSNIHLQDNNGSISRSCCQNRSSRRPSQTLDIFGTFEFNSWC
mmetsp:Transcript_32004/g.52868  ORF Transcript_32004/g.52868 Transcript_32004/m.52868 type:complete len:244 (-) Transcript_32004:711-1442(-)